MKQDSVGQSQVRLEARNIGGIDRTAVTFSPGVTVLAGRNATNRTSLLQAVMAALGSERVSVKGDADAGQVWMTVGDGEYTRELVRENGTILFRGEPYADDTELADLYAFLLGSNEARRTVLMEGDLQDIIMRPVDADVIEAEIRQLRSQRDSVDEQADRYRSLKDDLPDLKARREALEDRIEGTQETLTAKRDRLAEESEPDDEHPELEAKTDELQQARSELDSVEFQLESQRESLASLRDQRARLSQEYEELTGAGSTDPEAFESELSRLRERKRELDADLSQLQSVIQFNDEMLDGTSADIAAALRGDDASTGDGALTDQLVRAENRLVCWTCGSETERAAVEDTLDRLRTLRSRKYDERSDIEDQIEDVERELSSIESRQQREADLRRRLGDVDAEIAERERRVSQLEDEQAQLRDHIDQLEDEIETLEGQQENQSALLDLQTEVSRLEYELEDLRDDRDRIAEQIDDHEDRIAEIPALEQRREELTEQLRELRTRIDRIEQEAVEGFNDHMETVLTILDYDNLKRIWIERAEEEVREGRQTVTQSTFQLHVVRSTDDGVAYEDEFEHLSESEREVTGLIFALAGYLAHDAHETVPFMLLDSLEAIDSNRIAALVDYFTEYAGYLVVALLPEDAAALDESYERVTDI